jgi:acetyl-CoA carboxylase biotin carboxyl carrier protein
VLTFEQIKDLIELVARHGLAGVEVERSGFRLKIDGRDVAAAAQRGAPQSPAPAAAHEIFAGASPLPAGHPLALQDPTTAAAASPASAAGGAGTGASAAGGARPAQAEGLHILNSPIVGTFYRAPSPDAPQFVEVGSRVRKGQVLCIIEAMKLMNEIESDVDGVIVEIYPQNAQPVEFGEPLFAIRTA